MDEATRKAVDKIEKLMRLAGSNPNEAEASAALEKAQSLLVAYNLTMAVVDQASGQSGKRLDEQVRGGHHRYQRELWRHIAELNFCMYWSQKNRVTEETRRYPGHKFVHEHRLVGRQVNVASTRGMGDYIGAAIERMCQEKFLTTNYFALTSSDAMAYREGIADRVIEKVRTRRRSIVLEEEAKAAEAATRAAAAGTSLATTLTVSGLTQKEEAANYDFLHGEGAWARKEAENLEWSLNWEKRVAARAAAEAAAERQYTRWAEANPEEAARREKKAAAEERRRERRQASSPGRRYRFRQTKEEMRRSSGSYVAGYAAGEKVSIDTQVDKGEQRRIK